ncbi:MAG: HAMP domain-containing histidine kinase, partial [Calditerrivibrio sp.]|nr:HAMP domain-containing histidine kinase [Calditerrivibrio sp.]
NMVRSLENANKSIDNMHKSIIHSDRLMTIGKLTASISHEIKNPLNSIMITSDILLEHCKQKNENDRLKKFLESIIEDAQRIREIIDQTLNFSRYETEKNEIIKVRELIKIISIYSKRILFYKTNIKFMIADELTEDISIKGNKTNIEQMLINILKNSVESIPANKKGEIYMHLSNDDKFVKFKISDNGIGISKEKLELIFQEFYSTKTNGTGLGLSIVKEIVEHHNGKIDLESEENKGTTVIVELPIHRGEDA